MTIPSIGFYDQIVSPEGRPSIRFSSLLEEIAGDSNLVPPSRGEPIIDDDHLPSDRFRIFLDDLADYYNLPKPSPLTPLVDEELKPTLEYLSFFSLITIEV